MHDPGENSSKWVGTATPALAPPLDYWKHLERSLPITQVNELRELSDRRVNEFAAGDLSPPEQSAIDVLDVVAADGWLIKKFRFTCPRCDYEFDEANQPESSCPNCGEAPIDHGGLNLRTIYTRELAPLRPVDWMVAIHGMSTSGTWQEEFAWYFSTTWGNAVPVAVYKYGIVVQGVVMAWRRRSLQRELRQKLAVLQAEAKTQGFSGRPDLVAHSFGTWLVGHMLEDELKRPLDDRLKFGRIILAGCILRPDFDWSALRASGVVQEILNHYATKDRIVPLAQYTIWNSGPSGRRGFDSDEVINVRAEGYGHSDLFTVTKCVVRGRYLRPCGEEGGAIHNLAYHYTRNWRPFLTLPAAELSEIPDRADPRAAWRQMPVVMRGTIFPLIALPLVAALLLLGLYWGGEVTAPLVRFATLVAAGSGIGLALLVGLITAEALWRLLRRLR